MIPVLIYTAIAMLYMMYLLWTRPARFAYIIIAISPWWPLVMTTHYLGQLDKLLNEIGSDS